MIVIDFEQRTITKDGKLLKCQSVQQFNMLVYLTNANGKVKSAKEILQNCWLQKLVTEANVNQALMQLRRLINDPNPGKVIERVVNVGIRVVPGKIKIVNQNGFVSSKAFEGYVFVKYARFKDSEQVVILQSIKNPDDCIVVPKLEYQKDETEKS